MSSNNNDYLDAIPIVLLVVVFLLILLKEWAADYIFIAFYYMKFGVFWLISHIPEESREMAFIYTKPFEYIPPFNKYFPTVEGIKFDFVYQINVTTDWFMNMTFEEFFEHESRDKMMRETNKLFPILLYPITLLILIIMSKKIINKKRYKKSYSIETLGVQESKIWPQIQPVVHEYKDFINAKSLDEGWYAMSPKPVEYFKKNDLLEYFKNEDENDIDNFGKTKFRINPEKMHRFLVKELGKPWTGIEDMDIEKKCVLAIIIPKLLRTKVNINGKNEDLSKVMNDKLSKAYSSIKRIKINGKEINDQKHEKEVMKYRAEVHKEVEKVLENYFPKKVENKNKLISIFKKKEKQIEMPEQIKEILNNHFYEKVIFSIFLEESRKTGVLATCEFLWLKKFNRDLWYILSQTGRTASFCECSGAWAHLLTEKKVGRKISTPMVQKAIDAADKYLFETHDNYEPIGDFDDD